MKKKLLLSLLAVCGLMLGVFAQNKTVSGTVTGEDGAPIAGATVVVEGTSIGTTTDAAGHYSIAAPSDALLNVSFIGYLAFKSSRTRASIFSRSPSAAFSYSLSA